MACVLALAHLLVIFMRKFVGTFGSEAVKFVYYQFWIIWFAMPLLIGCAAVADERKLGTLESQLCLPVRRRTQFSIKFLSALLLALTLSLVMPLLFEGTRILPDIEIKSAGELVKLFPTSKLVLVVANVLSFVNQLLPILIPLGIAAVVASISFYASTLSRNTLQALAPAVLGIILTWILLLGALEIEAFTHYPLWRGWLIYLIGLPVLMTALVKLTYCVCRNKCLAA
jgi:ABC-type Na+ efflux pump permease subunit